MISSVCVVLLRQVVNWFSLDNCWRENKNRYVLAFLASLVELKVFVEAGIDFLIKGHTGMFQQTKDGLV